MNWLKKQVSLYKCLADNFGKPATFRDVLFTNFALYHEWYFRDYATDQWINGRSNDLHSILALRKKEMTKNEKMGA
jgi:hypothetical protein